MVGADEARARAALVEMQVQLSQGPHIALQVAEMATAEQVRRAFLELTKQFHPARFARMSTEVQRLANEVFLGIKAAHDSMLRALGASTRPGGVAQTGGTAIVTADGTSPPRKPSPAPTGALPRATSQLPPLQRPGANPNVAPRPTPSRGMPPRNPTPATGVPIARSNTPPLGVAIPRTLTPSSQRHQMPTRPSPMPPRPTTPSTTRPTTPRGADEINPGTLRYSGSPPPGPQSSPRTPAPAFDEKAALQEARDLMGARNWSAARVALHALAARVPQAKSYRAMLCYARGREAQASGKPDDAALEFQRALQLDPDLVQAKLALAEVRRR